jgi:hypothetical protein
VAPFKNATFREFRIPSPAGAGGFQFAGIDPGVACVKGVVKAKITKYGFLVNPL